MFRGSNPGKQLCVAGVEQRGRGAANWIKESYDNLLDVVNVIYRRIVNQMELGLQTAGRSLNGGNFDGEAAPAITT